MNLLDLNNNLQSEAKELLKQKNLLELLSKIGKIELGGSYVYGTMVDRDIDIAVIVNKQNLNLELRKKVINLLLDIKELDGLEMTDRVHSPKITSPYGIWFGPKFNYKGNKWDVDIWFVTQDEPMSHHNLEIQKRMLNITNAQRETILKIKSDLLKRKLKSKGTSANVYFAVLDNNISNVDEFIALN